VLARRPSRLLLVSLSTGAAAVPRGTLHVRAAREADLPAMVDLAEGLREALLPPAEPLAWTGTPSGRAALEQRFREALVCPDRHLVLVVGACDEPLGMALFTVSSASPLLDVPALHMSHAVVADRYRRRGAGKALVAAAAAYAEERGLSQLVVSVQPGSRESNRFFARLGFAPLAVRRVAPVTAVRRRLAQAELGSSEVAARRRHRWPVRVVAGVGPDLQGPAPS
jgi:ribosomal protein S18 acetylase RimI-like enzyme